MANDTFDPNVSSEDREKRNRITQRAYERFQARGGEDGHDMDDWLEAEREEELASQAAADTSSVRSSAGESDGKIRQNRVTESREDHARTTPRYVEERQLR